MYVEVMYSRKFISMLLIKKDLVCIQMCRKIKEKWRTHIYLPELENSKISSCFYLYLDSAEL